jgi:hypothetical protein
MLWARQTADVADEMADAGVAVAMRGCAVGFALVDEAAASADGFFAVRAAVAGGIAAQDAASIDEVHRWSSFW